MITLLPFDLIMDLLTKFSDCPCKQGFHHLDGHHLDDDYYGSFRRNCVRHEWKRYALPCECLSNQRITYLLNLGFHN